MLIGCWQYNNTDDELMQVWDEAHAITLTAQFLFIQFLQW